MGYLAREARERIVAVVTRLNASYVQPRDHPKLPYSDGRDLSCTNRDTCYLLTICCLSALEIDRDGQGSWSSSGLALDPLDDAMSLS
jgi:hypothetical protein